MIGIAAIAQPGARELEQSLARIERTIAAARSRGASLVVFPECALGGYLRETPDGPRVPEGLHLDGPEIARLVRAAGETVVCVGYPEAGRRGLHSSAVCLSGDGILGHHRKVHLPPAERFAFVAGDSFAAFDTPVGRLGMLVCYDGLFPEAARSLATDGAEIVACMAAWPMDRHAPAATAAADRQTRHFDLMAAARAMESQVVWVSANQSGRWGRLRFMAHAQVVDPDGIVRAGTGERAGMAFARMDVRAELAAVRAHIDHLDDRRPAAYATAPASPRTSVALAG